ncbi:MAG: glycosyltransferase family 4 protein [Solirubrobacterales bacterium]|nr:glycosyltransferase family 4 protein [Solirubrobacterales bacterium]
MAVYTDYVYRRVGGVLYAERAFALFVAALAGHVEQLTLIGRFAPPGEQGRYALPDAIGFVGLPHYKSLSRPWSVVLSLFRSLRRMWVAVNELDVVWVLGPYPHAIALVLVAMARRRVVVLGVRQDWPTYVRNRHPNRRAMHIAADVLEGIWRWLGRRLPVVAVGSELAASYAQAPAMLELVVSLVPAALLERTGDDDVREYDSELRVLSVGRLDQEKNPLLLADVLARLLQAESRWRLLVCGEGDLEATLRERLDQLGISDRAELLGYVEMGDRLLELYRSSHALLHVSWTEGFPQVLIEAFATGLPVVATDVGGVAAGVQDCALLIPPGDAPAAANALTRLISEPELRARLTGAAVERATALTTEAQVGRLVSFLGAAQNAGPIPCAPFRKRQG